MVGLTAYGRFGIYEIDPIIALNRRKARFDALSNLPASEKAFLDESLAKRSASLVVLAGRDNALTVVLTGLYERLSLLLTFTPSFCFSRSDFYGLADLRSEIDLSFAVAERIKASNDNYLDFSDRISRLLNLNGYLSRGVEYMRCSHDLMDMANSFATNFSYLCGADLRVNRIYPEAVFESGFDCSVFGMFLACVLCDSSDIVPVRLSFFVDEKSELYARIEGSSTGDRNISLALRLVNRFGIALYEERTEKGRVFLLRPVRPEVSLLGLKQDLEFQDSDDKRDLIEYD